MKRLSLFALLLSCPFSFAQTPATPPEPVVYGWKKAANLGANLSFASSNDVIGQTDGNSETYGLNLKASFNRVQEKNEWKTEGTLVGATTRTPSIPRYVKSNDELKVNTAFLHFWNGNKNFGPYARGEAAAPIFAGENVQATDKTYIVTNADATVETFTASSVKLTEGFKPLTTKESVGVFWRPKDEPSLKIETRLGFAGQQISASGQYAVTGTGPAGQILVTELRDVSQAGLEAAISIKGKIDEKSAYEAGLETLTPFVNNQQSGDDRDAVRLTNYDGFVKLTSNITSWAAFGYDYKMKLQPQLLDKVQQTHMIVLNVNYNLF